VARRIRISLIVNGGTKKTLENQRKQEETV